MPPHTAWSSAVKPDSFLLLADSFAFANEVDVTEARTATLRRR
jgi:hypothetical protein